MPAESLIPHRRGMRLIEGVKNPTPDSLAGGGGGFGEMASASGGNGQLAHRPRVGGADGFGPEHPAPGRRGRAEDRVGRRGQRSGVLRIPDPSRGLDLPSGSKRSPGSGAMPWFRARSVRTPPSSAGSCSRSWNRRGNSRPPRHPAADRSREEREGMMMATFSKQVALVTGGSRGIGRAICLELAGKGAYVAVNFRSRKEAAEETLALIRQAGGDGRNARFRRRRSGSGRKKHRGSFDPPGERLTFWSTMRGRPPTACLPSCRSRSGPKW